MEIKLIKTHPDAKLPETNDDSWMTGDTGYDLSAVEDIKIAPNSSAVVQVGLQLAYISAGFWFRIEPRSGLGFKNSIQPHLGVIDNGYRGDLGVKLYNFHPEDELIVKTGDRIAQLVIYQLIQADIQFTDHIDETARGSQGFGSTGR
jgi:dUTP pyrophosphatase